MAGRWRDMKEFRPEGLAGLKREARLPPWSWSLGSGVRVWSRVVNTGKDEKKEK